MPGAATQTGGCLHGVGYSEGPRGRLVAPLRSGGRPASHVGEHIQVGESTPQWRLTCWIGASQISRKHVQTQRRAFLYPHVMLHEEGQVGGDKKRLRLFARREPLEPINPDVPRLLEARVPQMEAFGVLDRRAGR